jgi:hypothetical protein
VGSKTEMVYLIMEKIQHTKDIFEYKNFLSKEYCEQIIDYWNNQDDWELTCFYNAYVISGKKPKKENFDNLIGPIYYQFQKTAESTFYKDLRPLSQSAHKWTPGAYAADHADNAELDGTPNGWQENKLVTILYLNDEYDGGYLTFRDHNIAIKPEAGTLMVFDVGIDNVHAVTEVKSGVRYTMMNSFDYADSVYNIDLKAEKEAVKPEQDKLKEEWQEGKIDPSSATMPKMV